MFWHPHNLTLVLVFLDETSKGMFLLYLLELAETGYLRVYGNCPVELFHVKKFSSSKDFRRSMVEVLQISTRNEKVNTFLVQFGISSSPDVTINWFCLLFWKFQNFVTMVHSVAINSLQAILGGIVFYTLLSPFSHWYPEKLLLLYCWIVLLDLRGWIYLKICISVIVILWVVHLDAKT